MRRFASRTAGLLLAAPLCLAAGQAAPAPQPPTQGTPAQGTPAQAPPAAKPPAASAPAIPSALAPDLSAAAAPAAAAVEQPCGARAARFESAKGFKMVITRAGQVRTTNPLRPLTPEVNEVLQVVIAGKLATAYGPDFASLRRGSGAGAVEAMLGGPIRWQPTLPALPDPMAIVSEDGTPLAQLAFRACEEPPAVKVPPPKAEARKKAPARRAPPKAAAEKTPPGFAMPQGAIAE